METQNYIFLLLGFFFMYLGGRKWDKDEESTGGALYASGILSILTSAVIAVSSCDQRIDDRRHKIRIEEIKANQEANKNTTKSEIKPNNKEDAKKIIQTKSGASN